MVYGVVYLNILGSRKSALLTLKIRFLVKRVFKGYIVNLDCGLNVRFNLETHA